MLTERNKARITVVVQRTIGILGPALCQHLGPSIFTSAILDQTPPSNAKPDALEDAENMRENREEAEQLIAALLGMA